MTEPVPRTLYTHPYKSAIVCLPDGSGWLVPAPSLPSTDGGWKIFSGDMDGGWKIISGDMEGRSPALFDLTDDEILRLCRAEDLTTTIAEIKAARCLQEARALEGRSTLYLTPREPAVLHESGNLWILYAAGSELSPPRPVPSEWIEIAQDLTSAEVASLVDPDKRFLSIFKILSARKPAPGERWRKAAERAEADRQEWQALALNHEGAIERLTRDLAEARETRDRALYAERAAGSRADAAEAEVERLRQVIVGLAAKIAGVRWLTAENPDPR